MTELTLTTNELWPGKIPTGTEVELVGQSASSVFVRIGRRTVKASEKWLDWPETERCPTCGREIEEGSKS